MFITEWTARRRRSVEDQQLGGLIMWVIGGVILAAWGIFAFLLSVKEKDATVCARAGKRARTLGSAGEKIRVKPPTCFRCRWNSSATASVRLPPIWAGRGLLYRRAEQHDPQSREIHFMEDRSLRIGDELFGLVRVACYQTMLRPCVISVGHGFCSVGAHRFKSESVLTVHRGQRFPIETKVQGGSVDVAPEALQRRCQIAAGGSFLSEQVVDNGHGLFGGVALIATDGDALADLQWQPSADLVFRRRDAR